MANIITCCRILCSIILLFFPAFSPWFYILYLLNGLSDMIDGTIARKLGTVGELGSKLDTVADIIFVTACMIKILPAIHIPVWLLIWTMLIAVIKIINVVFGMIRYKKFLAMHSVMNKVTGLLLFILPLTLKIIKIKFSAVFICGIATFVAFQEGYFIRIGRIEK